MKEDTMKKLNDEELDMISGGNYFIYNNDTVAWGTIPGSYALNCSRYDAMAVMDALVGKFSTVEEYDNACFDALAERGWLK